MYNLGVKQPSLRSCIGIWKIQLSDWIFIGLALGRETLLKWKAQYNW